MWTSNTPIDFSRWFVATLKGDGGTSFLVCAATKIEALATFMLVRSSDSAQVLPIQSWDEYRKIHCLAGDNGSNLLSYQVGIRHPNTIVTGTVILIT